MDPKHVAKPEESVKSSRLDSKAQSTLTVDQSEKNVKGREAASKRNDPVVFGNSGMQKAGAPSEVGEKPNSPKPVELMPRLKRPENETLPLMNVDEKFRKRWHIEGIIGKGGYGEIYLAIDMKRAEEVAIKAEPKERKGKVAKRMILEQQVLLKMQGKPHVPIIFASGHTEKFNFIILQLLSKNLGDIRRMSPVRRLSRGTVGRITVQGIAALRDLHQFGYLHRDVKPANMCFGITPRSRHVLMLLDFGLVRRYKESNGEWRPHRPRTGFRGTQRYVSVRVHKRMEQVPADDVTSLLYTAFELLAGELPWRGMEKNDDIWKVKEAFHGGRFEFFHSSTRDLIDFSKLVSNLDPMSDPRYAILQNSLKKLYLPKRMSDPYDWEDGFKDALMERTQSTTDDSS